MENNNSDRLVFQLSWKAALFCVIAGGIGCFFLNPLWWWAGIGIGYVFTVLRLVMMNYAVHQAVSKDPAKAKTYFTLQYLLRYLLSAAVLVLAVKLHVITFYSTMLALFSLKIATFIQGFFEKKAPKDGSVIFETWVDEEEEAQEESWDRWQTYNLKASKKIKKREGRLERREVISSDPGAVREEFTPEEPSDDQLSLFDEMPLPENNNKDSNGKEEDS